MHLNFFAYFLISIIPLVLGVLWYQPSSPMIKWAYSNSTIPSYSFDFRKLLLALLLSLILVGGYANLIIHQMGFYELFFTDIMQGSEKSQQIVDEFLAVYGDKHRHFGHGVFHGAINAIVFALPFIGFFSLTEKIDKKKAALHFGYWFATSVLIGGLISEFV